MRHYNSKNKDSTENSKTTLYYYILPVIARHSKEYTDDQYTCAEDTLRLHRRLGHPTNKKLTTILNNNNYNYDTSL